MSESVSTVEVTAYRDQGVGGVGGGMILGVFGVMIWMVWVMTSLDDAKGRSREMREKSSYSHQHYNGDTVERGTIYGTE